MSISLGEVSWISSCGWSQTCLEFSFTLSLFSMTWAEIVRMWLIYNLVIAIHFSHKELYLHFVATCYLPLVGGVAV